MKKGLLLVLAVLLVAGLFVSCNSDVSANAGASSKDYAYVTFDKASASKSVSPTVDPADAPNIDDLYWYYQATKASGTVHEGQTSGWTRVKASGKGLSGTIGPFSVGEWYFALVGITSESEPSSCPDVTYSLAGDTVTWGGYADTSVRYIGISGISGYTTKENVNLEGNQSTTYIPMSLQQVNMTSKVTVKLDGLVLVGNSGIDSGKNVWLDVLKGDSPLGSTIAVTAGASGAVVPANTSLELELSSAVEHVTLNFKLYDKTDDNAPVVKEASVSFLATKGATVTLSGSLDAINVYGTFAAPENAVAFVVSSSTGTVTFYESLGSAISAAQAGDTVVLLKNVESSSVISISKSITLEGNGKSITSTAKTGTSSEFVYIHSDSETINVDINNLTIVTTHYSYGLVYEGVTNGQYLANGTVTNCSVTSDSVAFASCGSKTGGTVKLYENLVTVNNCTFTSTGKRNSSDGIYNAAVSTQGNGKAVINSGTFTGPWSAANYTSGGTVVINGGTFNGPMLLYGNTGYGSTPRYDANGEFVANGAANMYVINGGTINLAAVNSSEYSTIADIINDTSKYSGGFVFKDNNMNVAEVIINGGTYNDNNVSFGKLTGASASGNKGKISVLTSTSISCTGYSSKATTEDYTVYTK